MWPTAWRKLPSERRLAAIAAILLFVSLFFPWYQETVIARGSASNLRSASASMTGWGAFSFVEAAILLVAGGVLMLLFQRAEGRAFHIPGGDGGVIMAAGLWACVLMIWRMFDKQGTSSHGQFATTSGIEWGIFVALAVAGLLAYAGLADPDGARARATVARRAAGSAAARALRQPGVRRPGGGDARAPSRPVPRLTRARTRAGAR